jgi:protein-disulfide isomerase
MQVRPPQQYQSAPKTSGNGWIWALFGCLGCFGLLAVVGAAGAAFWLVQEREQEALYGPIGPEPYDPYAGDPLAPDPLGGPTIGGGLAGGVERFRVPLMPDDPRRGPEDALVTIVEIGDFQCPFCARAAATMRDLERQYPGQIRFVWKDNPLPFHTEAMPAAILAAEARVQQGDAGFWRLHDVLFENTRALSRQDLERYARAQGLDVASVRRALDARTHEAGILADQAFATQIGARGTPSFFINGRQLNGAQPIESFRTIVDEEIATALSMEIGGTPRARIYDELTRNGRTSPAPEPAADPVVPQEDPNRVHRVPIDGSPQRGPDDALVTVVAFSDFQCPFCARVTPTLDRIVETYGRDVRIVFKHYPLPFHQDAQPAAEAAIAVREAAGDAGFWRMHDILFENQRDLSLASLERYARRSGASATSVRRALDTGAHRAAVQRDMDLGQRLGRLGTPTFFVNGKKVSGAQSFETFRDTIDRELAAARALVATGTPRAGVYDAVMSTAE